MAGRIQLGKTGVYVHRDGPLNKDIPIWYHCSEYFAFDAPALARVYQRNAPPPPPAPVAAHESGEFPVLGTPFVEDNVDSEDEGGMGAQELGHNAVDGADMGRDTGMVGAFWGDEEEEEEEAEEEAEESDEDFAMAGQQQPQQQQAPAQPQQPPPGDAEHLENLRGLLGDDQLAEAVHEQVDNEVLAEAFMAGDSDLEDPGNANGGGGSNVSVCASESSTGGVGNNNNTSSSSSYGGGGSNNTHAHVVVVMHGCLGNVARYMKAWKPIANLCGLLVICPQFSPKEFPEYTTGNMFDRRTGRAIPKDQWLFSAVERIFDGLAAMGIHRTHYHIYGHSSGAQFVHRMMMFLPEARISVGVSANAGWYTFPSQNVSFPYGLQCAGLGRDTLRRSMSSRLVVLLGQEDSKTVHLRRTGRSLAQGVNRFDRGMSYFLQAKRVAHDLGVPLQWTLATVEGVAHQHSVMAIAAMSSFGLVPLPRPNRMPVAA